MKPTRGRRTRAARTGSASPSNAGIGGPSTTSPAKISATRFNNRSRRFHEFHRQSADVRHAGGYNAAIDDKSVVEHRPACQRIDISDAAGFAAPESGSAESDRQQPVRIAAYVL